MCLRVRVSLFFMCLSLPCVLLFCCGLLWFCLGRGFNFTSVLWPQLWFSDQKTLKNGTQMLPKGLQKRCWRGYGGYLGALVDERLVQDVSFDDLGSLLGPFWEHVGGPFWYTFLMSFGNGLWGLFLIDSGPQKTSKKRPKREPKQELQNHRFCCYLLHLAQKHRKE